MPIIFFFLKALRTCICVFLGFLYELWHNIRMCIVFVLRCLSQLEFALFKLSSLQNNLDVFNSLKSETVGKDQCVAHRVCA